MTAETLADLWHAVRMIYIDNGVDPDNFNEEVMPECYVVKPQWAADIKAASAVLN